MNPCDFIVIPQLEVAFAPILSRLEVITLSGSPSVDLPNGVKGITLQGPCSANCKKTNRLFSLFRLTMQLIANVFIPLEVFFFTNVQPQASRCSNEILCEGPTQGCAFM